MACECCEYGNAHYDQDLGWFDKVECLFPYSVSDIVPNKPKDLIRGRWYRPRHTCDNFMGKLSMEWT